MDELLGISDFSARCGLSVKMLRTYAARGLLVPAAVDASSGYRYYAVGQLHQARIVGLLRQAGIPVADIAAFVGQPTSEPLDRWARQIDREWDGRRTALDAARAALALPPAADVPPAASVTPSTPSLPSTPSPAKTKGEVMRSTLIAGSATHIGGRPTNEDALEISERVFAVADGLGGVQMGDVASRLALDALGAALRGRPSVAGLQAAGLEVNEAVWRRAQGREAAMGTTLTALALTDDAGPVVLHVGDSRLYRLRAGRLEQLTQDHTVTADLVRTGALEPEEVASHPHRHVLTRALGVAPVAELDEAPLAVEPGDRLLLCTDGLSGAFEDMGNDALREALSGTPGAQACAEALVSRAVAAGAMDNATAVVVDVG